MTRPNIKDYCKKKEDIPITPLSSYVLDLEKYCDKLEKALDKASVKLSELERQYNFLCGNMNHRNKLYWKEWCLEDD